MTECLVCGLEYLYQKECPGCKVRRELDLPPVPVLELTSRTGGST